MKLYTWPEDYYFSQVTHNVIYSYSILFKHVPHSHCGLCMLTAVPHLGESNFLMEAQ